MKSIVAFVSESSDICSFKKLSKRKPALSSLSLLVFVMFRAIFNEIFNVQAKITLWFIELKIETGEKVLEIVRISSLRAEAAAIFQNFQNKFF